MKGIPQALIMPEADTPSPAIGDQALSWGIGWGQSSKHGDE